MKTYSKSDVAKSQLEEAIKLFFEKRDPISIHTLINSSHQIMRDIAKVKNIECHCIIESLIQSSGQDIKQSYKAAFQPRNFCKHADKNSDEELNFDGLENELWLLDSCVLYGQVMPEQSNSINSFWSWYILNNPEIQEAVNIPSLVKVAELLKIEKTDYDYFREHCD